MFGIGWHKTGTSTLARCLSVLGHDVCPEEYGYLVSQQVAELDYRFAMILARTFDGFQDSPWNYRGVYRVMEAAFPEAKFVMTVRNGDLWYRSVLRWCAAYSHNTSRHMTHTIGMDVLREPKAEVIKTYHDYLDEVRAELDPSKLLVVDWEAGDRWARLCEFLGKPVPRDTPFPHALKYDQDTGLCETHESR